MFEVAGSILLLLAIVFLFYRPIERFMGGHHNTTISKVTAKELRIVQGRVLVKTTRTHKGWQLIYSDGSTAEIEGAAAKIDTIYAVNGVLTIIYENGRTAEYPIGGVQGVYDLLRDPSGSIRVVYADGSEKVL
jgi:hypothetical protein